MVTDPNQEGTVTITEQTTTADFELVADDLYRDIHKGIRAELFALTLEAGRIDPAATPDRVALAGHVHRVADVLVSHAEHEDRTVTPALEVHLPAFAERITTDHVVLDGRLVALRERADAATSRANVHHLYLEVASFVGDYLHHQDFEERVVMPALEAAVGVDAVVAMHHEIVSSIPPDEMAQSLTIMLPAMNIDDRTELLSDMRAGAPAQVFEGVWGLAGTVLTPSDHAALAARLGLT